jgi:NitT/TauT family transport system substrate-binding protein
MGVLRHIACSLLVLLGALAAPPAGGAQEKIRLGLLPFSESLAAVVADRQGFFKAEGIEVEVTKFGSGAQALPVLLAGRLDIIINNTITTLQALEQGADLTLLAPGAAVRAAPPDTTTALMVLNGAARTPKDLEGKRIAINVINSSAWLYLVALLDKHGVDRSKVRIVEISFPQMNDPLLNRQVDAIGQVEPFRTALLGTGKAEVIGWSYVETQPNADITQYEALTSWVEKHRATAQKFARAVVRAARFINDPANDKAVREINQQFTNLNPEFKDKVLLPRFGTEVNLVEIRKTGELMVKFGLIKQPLDLSKRVLAIP